MTTMQGYPDIVFYSILILQIIGLALLARFVLHHNNLRLRILIPMLALAGTGIVGGFLKQIGPDMGGILFFMIPALAVLTLFPFAEQYTDVKRPGLAVALFSLLLTFMLLWYLFGMALGGVGIFLPLAGIGMFTGVWVEVRLVSVYLELLMLGVTLLGMIMLVQEVSLPYSRDPAWIVLYSLLIVIAAALFNTVAVGFFVVFMSRILTGIKYKLCGVLISVLCATVISLGLSSLPVTYQYTDVARHYDPSLYVLVLVAMGVLTLVPLLFRYMDTKYRYATLYATATITVVILPFLSRSPVPDSFHAIVAGVSTLAGSGLFVPGVALSQGVAQKMLLYAESVVISSVIFAGILLAGALCRKKNVRTSPSPIPVQDRVADQR